MPFHQSFFMFAFLNIYAKHLSDRYLVFGEEDISEEK